MGESIDCQFVHKRIEGRDVIAPFDFIALKNPIVQIRYDFHLVEEGGQDSAGRNDCRRTRGSIRR